MGLFLLGRAEFTPVRAMPVLAHPWLRACWGLKLPDICLTGGEKPRKNRTQETCPDRGSNPGPLRDKRACYHLLHSGGLHFRET